MFPNSLDWLVLLLTCALAARLRRETTLSIKQIAERLTLGKPKGAKSNLHTDRSLG